MDLSSSSQDFEMTDENDYSMKEPASKGAPKIETFLANFETSLNSFKTECTSKFEALEKRVVAQIQPGLQLLNPVNIENSIEKRARGKPATVVSSTLSTMSELDQSKQGSKIKEKSVSSLKGEPSMVKIPIGAMDTLTQERKTRAQSLKQPVVDKEATPSHK